jgi:hypothetical protein
VLAAIEAREELLADRMKALSVREEIFKSAAKSQSAKAPRRTKTNPEPLSTIRQGTDYAITQLEAVYQSRRKAEKELAQLGERRKRLQNDAAAGGTLVRVWVKPAAGAVAASWAVAGRSWSPLYDVRVDGGTAAVVTMFPGRVTPAREEKITLIPGQLQNAAAPAGFAYSADSVPLLRESFRISSMQGGSLRAPLSLQLDNSAARTLPGGDAVCYQDGVYIGQGQLQASVPGKNIEISCSGR